MILDLARRAKAKLTRWRSAPTPAPATRDGQFNVDNMAAMRAEAPDRYHIIRCDPNNTCNIHCVYCHNFRSDATVPTEVLRDFLHENVVSANIFQFGCGMEPTMDMRLADLMLMVRDSPARPRDGITLQTNGILLNRHDAAKMRDAGLSELSVSVDGADTGIQKSLRGGMSLDRLLRNVDAFRAACPETRITFIATVTAENVDSMADLIGMGLSHGTTSFVLREMFYHPDNNVVDHGRMPQLVLAPGRFAEMERDIRAAFDGRADILYAPSALIRETTEKMMRDSNY